MAKAAAHFGVSDATLSAVARMVVARFNGLTYEEAVTLSVEFLETVSDMFMGERVKGVAVRQHVGKVVRVVAESCMEAAQESPLFDSSTKINVDPSLLDNLDRGSMGALGATTIAEALALFEEIRHGACLRGVGGSVLWLLIVWLVGWLVGWLRSGCMGLNGPCDVHEQYVVLGCYTILRCKMSCKGWPAV